MNQAMQNERLAVRQKLIDAYRVPLSAAQEKLEASWKAIDDEAKTQRGTLPASALFAHFVRANLADGVVVLQEGKGVAYPVARDGSPSSRPDATWLAAQELERTDKAAAAVRYGEIAKAAQDPASGARALQAQVRCLLQLGAIPQALAVINGQLQEARYAQALDPLHRLIVPNTELLALESLSPSQSEQARSLLDRLRARALNYDHAIWPSSQRRFILRELERRSPTPFTSQLLAGEELAAAYVEAMAGSELTSAPSFHRSKLPGVWETSFGNGEIITLHRAEALSARLRAMISPSNLPPGVQIEFLSPSEEKVSALLVVSAGSRLPGWRLALSWDDAQLSASAVQERISTYRWIGLLMVLAVVVLVLLAWGLVRRQIALTELRNDLVANVTHELKTPLASMRLLVDTLMDAPKWDEQQTREYLQLISTENLRLSRLIGNFLTFSRIERNKYSFHFELVSAQAIVTAAVAALGDRFQSPNCHFEVITCPDPPCVTADADAMVTALVNLLDNAWKYSGEAKHIVLSSGVKDGSVYWSVRDNGIGLSPRDTKRVFQRFYQVQPHLSHSGGGAGLGLSIVQFIVDAHRGSVAVESELGQGSTFTITLPWENRPASIKPTP